MPKRPSQVLASREESMKEISDSEEFSEDEFELEEGINEEEEEEEEEEDDGEARVFRPGKDSVEEGEELVAAPGTYKMLHRLELDWPCLSFDFLEGSSSSDEKLRYPLSTCVVAGTQADRPDKNKLYVMRWHGLSRLPKEEADSDDSESESESDEDDAQDAQLSFRAINHPGCVNRVRSMPQAPHVVATWGGDEGKVYIWNVQKELEAVSGAASTRNFSEPNTPPIFTFAGHEDEGYAMAWNPASTGQLITGDNRGGMFRWNPAQGGGWSVDSVRSGGEGGKAVEDVQFKKTGLGAVNTLGVCGGGGFVAIADLRENRVVAAINDAHDGGADVNVLSWNPNVGELLLTGADDGSFKVWDARNFQAGALANFHWHKEAIVSVDWHPTDDAVLAVASADDSVSLWDMSLEADEVIEEDGGEYFPPQLLFLHQGQQCVKELRFHNKHQGVVVTTALDGFNIFKTINV